MFAGKRYWIIGASEGLGLAIAERMSAEGASLVLSARNADRLKTVAQRLHADAVPVDVSDLDACRRAAAQVGQIDGLILSPAVYWPMPIGAWNAEQIETMCDVNFTGIARVLSVTVPDMVTRDAGHIVLIGSLSGFRGLPGAFGYASAKAGMMHLAESLHADLCRTGVRVQLVNPGFIRTRLTDKNGFRMPFLMDTDTAASHVVQAMKTRRFQTNFPRVFSWLFRGSVWLPAWVYYRIFGRR